MNLSEEVRKLSKELNISLSEIARRTNQSPANLSKKLNKETLSFEDFEKILEAIGVQLECGFILPGQNTARQAGENRWMENRMKILEKELELEKLKNEYYASCSFALRTALETLSGSVNLLERHGDDAQRVKSICDRLHIGMEQLMQIVGEEMNPPAESMERKEKGSGHVSFDGKRALVVDDNAINRDIVVDLLADSGLDADVASNGKEAVEITGAAPAGYYDFILMDLQMPEMDGFTAASMIRGLENGSGNIPIIAMTADDSKMMREKASSAGMSGFALKPLNMQKLFAVLSSDTDD